MANAWDESDLQLQNLLNAWVTVQAPKTYRMYLYSNDYTPHPGTTGGDFTNASFPDYVPQEFLVGDFLTATVTDHVANIYLNHPVMFQGSPTGSWTAVVYGYVVYDEFSRYLWSERFANPIHLVTGGFVQITPRLKHRTCAPS